MTLTPRADERKAISALLESEDFDSADSLAAAVLKRAFELFQQRALYGLRWGVGGSTLAVGPFATEADAQRFYKAVGSETESAVARLHGPGLFADVATPAGVCECGHLEVLHKHEKGRGWCWALGGSIRTNVNHCGCKSYKQKEE